MASVPSTTSTRTKLLSVSLLACALLQLKPETSLVASTLRNKASIDKIVKVVNDTKTSSNVIQTNGSIIHDIPASKTNKKSEFHGDEDSLTKLDKSRNKTISVLSTEEPIDDGIFNYTAFWEHAMDDAFGSLAAEYQTLSPPAPPCPKVYVYDLPFHLRDGPNIKTKQNTFGPKVDDATYGTYLYKTNQYALSTILEYRLKHSQQCQTDDPNKADLFYVPVLTKPKLGRQVSQHCNKLKERAVLDAMPYLNSTNACRHFFSLAKGHYNGRTCAGWFYKPVQKLNNTQRLAYSHFNFGKTSAGVHSYKKSDTTPELFPNLHSVPYPSSFHFRANKSTSKLPQFLNTTKRKTLMSFIGSSSHGDTEVRKRIVKSCRKSYHNARICKSSSWKPQLATAKAKSIFCLEPAGDSPWRKSLADSITFGCIPVLFSELTDDIAPWFWSDWKARARVLVPRDEFVKGHIDLQKLLQSIPKKLLELMQTTLKEKARQFQYSVDDDQEDGIRIILDNLHREALRMEQQGICGYY